MAYYPTTVRPGTLVPGSKEANIERVALESFSIGGYVQAGTKFGTCWDTPWAIIPVRNSAGHTYRVLVFQDQAPEIWELSNAQQGDKLLLTVHPYNTAKTKELKSTHKVCQKLNELDHDPGRNLLSGSPNPVLTTEQKALAYLQSGSQNWKEYKNDLYKYLPI